MTDPVPQKPNNNPQPPPDPPFMPTLLPAYLLPKPEEKAPAPAKPAAPAPKAKPPPRTEQVPAAAAAPPAKRPKRWKKILLWTGAIAAGLVVVVAIFGPMVIAPIVKSKVVAILNEKLNGTAELQEFSFGWGGSVHIGGLSIKDDKGEVIFSTKKVTVDASVMSALGGTYIAEVRVEDPVIVVRHRADGRFNFETLLKPEAPKPVREPTTTTKEKKEEKLPTVKANVSVTGGSLTFYHSDGRSTPITGITAKIAVDTLDKPVTFDVAMGGIGALTAKGAVTIAKDGKLDLDHLHGPIGFTMSEVTLSKLLPVVAAFAPIAKLEGRLSGTGEYELTSMTSVKGGGGFELRGLEVEGAALPEPVKIELIKLTQNVTIDASGTGTERVTFDMGDFLSVVVDAKTDKIATEMGSADATITMNAKLKGLTQALGPYLKMKQGYTLDGTASVKTTAKVAAGLKGLGAASAVVDATLENLAATDEKGHPLPIDPSATLSLKGSYDPAGLANIETCELRAGTVVVSARGGGDIHKLTFSDSVLKIDADLDDVAKKVASFMNLGFSFGGKVHVDSKLEGSGDIAKATSTVRVSALRLIGFQGKNLGPIDLTLDETGTVDMRAGGRSTLDSFKLVSGLVDIEAKGDATDAMDVKKVAGAATFSVKAYPAAINEKLGDFLMGYKLQGTDLLVSGEATFRGAEVTLRGDFKTRDLVVNGPQTATLKEVSAIFSLAANYETLDAEFRDITLECGTLDAAMPEMSASLKGVMAKLTGSKKGDDVAVATNAKIGELAATVGTKRAKAAGIAVDGDVSLNAKTFDAASKSLTVTVKTADAGMDDMTAAIRDIVVKLSGSKAGDQVVAKADVKVRDVMTMTPQLGPKGAVVVDLSLDGDVTADLKSFDADAKRVVFNIASIDAWLKDAAQPVGVRGFNVACNGTKSGDVLDLVKLTLTSSIAKGSGAARITNLMKGGMVANGSFDFGGDIAPLVDLAKAVMPDLKDAKSSGTWKFLATIATKGERIEVVPTFKIAKLSLDGAALKVIDADIALEARALVETQGTGKATIESCSLTAPGASVKATGTAAGFLGDPMKPTATIRVDATLQPNELNSRLSAFLFGNKIEGETATAGADITIDGLEKYTAKGSLTAPLLKVTMPATAPADPKAPKPDPIVITQTGMSVEFDVTADIKTDEELIAIKKCTYVSRTATATAEGEVYGLGEKMKANVTVKATAELIQLFKDVAGLVPKEYELGGQATATFDVVGNSGKLNAIGGVTINQFVLTVTKPNEKPQTVTEPKLELTCDAIVTMVAEAKKGMWRDGRMDVELKSAKVKSGFCSGTATGEIKDAMKAPEFKGLKGDFTYVPDKLGAVLQPWLPGKLSGAEEQKIGFTLEGKASSFDPFALLRGSTGGAKMGIGQFTMTGLAAKGGADVVLKDQHATTTTTLGVNGGQTDLTLDADLRDSPQAVSKMSANLKKVGANGEMSPLLQLIHPLFAVAAGTVDGMIDGKIDCSLEVTYRGALSTPFLLQFSKEKGWEKFDNKKGINGKGHFEISGLGLKGTPFLTALLNALEISDSREIEVNPLDFVITNGRVEYARPMKMKLAGQLTTWTGTIGLDQTLDLMWHIPITERLVKRYDFLKYWKGTDLEVMVKGTATAPRLMWAEFLADATAKAAAKAIEEKGGDLLEGLLGDKDAKKLLEQADALYDQGKKKEAAVLYKKIHEEYKKTKTYDRHKDRIKARELEGG